jgi:biotin transporter BioY
MPPDLDINVYMIEQHLVLVILASVISFGVTEVIKPFVSIIADDRERKKAIVRLLAILAGAVVGYTLGPNWLDVWFGAGAGTLNAWLVAVLKKKVEDRLHVTLDKTPPPTKPSRKPEETDDEQR